MVSRSCAIVRRARATKPEYRGSGRRASAIRRRGAARAQTPGSARKSSRTPHAAHRLRPEYRPAAMEGPQSQTAARGPSKDRVASPRHGDIRNACGRQTRRVTASDWSRLRELKAFTANRDSQQAGQLFRTGLPTAASQGRSWLPHRARSQQASRFVKEKSICHNHLRNGSSPTQGLASSLHLPRAH